MPELSQELAVPASEPPSEDVADEFRIEGPRAVRAIVRDLMDRNVPLALYVDGRASAIAANLAHVGEASAGEVPDIEIDLAPATDVGEVQALLRAGCATAVALPQGVKIQFRLDPLTVVAEAGASNATVPSLHAPLPALLYRIQRRDAFRVQPPAQDDATCVHRTVDGGEVRLPLIDLSVGGASVRLDAAEPAPAPGEIWQHNRIESRAARTIPCDLLVLRTTPHDDGGQRVALAFHALPPEVLRTVQMYVVDIEKRLRAMREI